ncbi:nucleotidyl transferase AbiEii/AbiGii toxin family protein [Flavobacterium sp.]|uniref:nucleotidyl transferase AbiEii/AbiGii toxin family protein n=1 Tax=Flavobacterium sp. TaxID=239 RepID=UPI0039E55935
MLHYNTVSPLLKSILDTLMEAEAFEDFRLVGGTALSLYYGHRMSVDIDLFTDAEYSSVDFEAIDTFLRETYKYVDTNDYDVIGMGKSYYVGNHEDDCIKLDLFYVDSFFNDAVVIDNIRIATVEEIIAMKLEIVVNGGRKKDFWDIVELSGEYSFDEMLALHEKRYPFSHDRDLLIANFTDFDEADDDFEPDCLRGRHWELVKLDIVSFVEGEL